MTDQLRRTAIKTLERITPEPNFRWLTWQSKLCAVHKRHFEATTEGYTKKFEKKEGIKTYFAAWQQQRRLTETVNSDVVDDYDCKFHQTMFVKEKGTTIAVTIPLPNKIIHS